MKKKKENKLIKKNNSRKLFLFFSIFDIIIITIGNVGEHMNNKGQALVEFVLILPVFLMILFVIVDFGTILNNKSMLENDSAEIIEMYKNGDSINDISKIYSTVKITSSSYKDKYTKIVIEKNVKLITPGMNRILDNPYPIKIERVISNA
jgi:uncharacterized protein (UPF0333 family)